MLLCLNATQAQRGTRRMDPEKVAAKQTEMMVEKLTLDTLQAAQVEEINLKYALQMQDMRKEVSSRDEAREMMQAMQQEKEAELQAVLTEEQWADWEEVRSQARKRLRSRHGNKGF